jgi:hypothetical protein
MRTEADPIVWALSSVVAFKVGLRVISAMYLQLT